MTDRTAPHRIAALAALSLASLAACGSEGAPGPSGDTVAAPATPPAGGPVVRAPTPIEYARGEAVGAAGSGELASTQIAPDVWMAPTYVSEFVVSEGFPELPGNTTGFVYDAGETPTAEQATQLAAAFGLAGDAVAFDDGYRRGWRVGPDDYSEPSLRLTDDAQQWWQYSPASRAQPVGDACAAAGSAGAAVDPPVLDTGVPVNTVCDAPAGVPTAEQAAALARDLLVAVGVDPDSVVVETHADEWSATVAVNEPLPRSVDWAEGTSTGRTWSFGWGAEGALHWASGALAMPQPVGPYPLIDLDAAVARLHETLGGSYGPALDMPLRVVAPATVPASDDAAAVSPPGIPPVTGDVEPLPVPVGSPAEPQPITVTLVDVQADLWWTWDAAGNNWLVPAYRFTGDDGGWYTVPAIADEYLVEVSAPSPSVPSEPVPVPPTTVAPDGTDAALVALVGLPLEEFTTSAAQLGYATWVGYDDAGSHYGEPTPTGPYVTVYTTTLDGIETTTIIAEVVNEVVDTLPATSLPPGPVAVVEVVENVAHYPACANSSYVVGDTTWYPVVAWGDAALAELHRVITSAPRAEPDGPQGIAARVPAPGPGDDVGTLVVWADGVARFTSDSGLVEWATIEPQDYNWVC